MKSDGAGRVWTPREQPETVRYEFGRGGMPAANFADHIGVKDPTLASWVQEQRTERGATESMRRMADL